MAGPLRNHRRELFAQGLVSGKTINQAYIDAGYWENNGNAGMMNKNPDVVARVTELKQQFVERIIVSKQEVLTELRNLALSDLRKAVEWGPSGVNLKSSNEIDDEVAAAISEVKEDKDGKISIKFHNKFAALEALGRHLGLFTEHVEVQRVGGEDIVRYLEEKLLGGRKLIDITPTPSRGIPKIAGGDTRPAHSRPNGKRS
jgi:phage terminase small subunit